MSGIATPPDHGRGRASGRLGRRRAQARLTLWFERLWPALWPACGVAGLYVALALFGLPQALPALAQAALLAVFVLAFLGLLWRGLSGVQRPSPAAVDRRLEDASGLAHQPLALLTDRPALADPAGQVLWQLHVARAIASIDRLRVGAPHPGLARRDRMALRGGLIVALVAAIGVAGPEAGPRLLAAFTPTLPAGAAPPPPQLQAWITPPAYTGVAPVFLHPEGGAVAVPAGSHLTISLTGGTGQPSLALDGHSEPFRSLAEGSWQAESDLTVGGRLVVRRRGRSVAAWDLTALADEPPVVSWAAPPGPSSRDQFTRLPWTAADDYGVASVQAAIRLKDRPDAPPLVVAIPLPGTPRSAHGVAMHDLTANPWAGLPVMARLTARDGPGQQGTSADAAFVLPERRFLNPVARAVIAVRKGLSLHPEDRAAAIAELARIASAPDDYDNDDGVFLNLSAVVSLLASDGAAAAVPQAQERLWELALHLEEASPDRTARALADARQALRQTLEDAKQGNPDKRDIDRRVRELQQAIQQHLQALLQEAQREGKTMPPLDTNAPHMTDRDLQRMVEQLRQAMQQGRMQDAEQQMAQLEQTLRALEHARPGDAQDARNAQQRQRGQQQMGALQDMLQRQSGVLDHTQQRGQTGDPMQSLLNRRFPQFPGVPGLPGQPQPGQQGDSQPGGRQPGDQQSQNADQAARDKDARTQNALRRALGELMQQFGDLTGKVPGSLGEADQAMQQAGQALAQGQDKEAAGAEERAVEALSKGGQQMGQQMASQFGVSQPGQGQDGQNAQDGNGDGQGDGTGDAQGSYQGNYPGGYRGTYNGQGRYGDRQDGPRDPFGRLTGQGNSGADEGSDVQIPDQAEQARTRAIQDELRRREGERTRPQQELDYIQRLLKLD